ncbi:MAG TPA: glycogen/starch synthase [Candidatus Caenarcaniphilales bacterium]|nr:glycogen/starch synthase [Candidatus Caenarcaniphilales bacterium]
MTALRFAVMRVAMVASECEPFAKTGGLADVVDALARALGDAGHEVDVYLPRYRGVDPPAPPKELPLAVPLGTRGTTAVTVLSAPADGYRLRLVDHPPSYDRPDYYVQDGRDYPDNGARFALLGRAALEAIRAGGEPVDVVHGHDWEGSPGLLLLEHRYATDKALRRTAAVLTCHNLAYHGWVPRPEVAAQLDLPGHVGSADGVDLLREGIGAADIVNTVSPTFARESLSPEFGAGVDDALRALGDRYVGILNGIDTELWDPATDSSLPARYSRADPAGKAVCRAALCAELGLDADGPLMGMVGRLDPQKGFDLLTAAAPALLAEGARICVLGTGDHDQIVGLGQLAKEWPRRLRVEERFDRGLARRIYAGADFFLMPSRFEPCGQGQMIALRYGTLPIVHGTGGLADTIRDADAERELGNGFVFRPAEPSALLEACRRAMAARVDEQRWLVLRDRAMAADFSWEAPAREYVAAYRRASEIAARGD